MNETSLTHTPVEKATITFCMFQIAKLEGTMSMYFGKMAVRRKYKKPTCEA